MASPSEQLDLDAQPVAVAEARHWLRSQLGGWSPDGLQAAQLVISELVTNVVLHGEGPINVAVGARAPGVVIEVVDRSGALPVMNRYGRAASTGRGLLLVDGVARGWGVRVYPNGKGVWAVLDDAPIVPRCPQEPAAPGTERGEAPPDWPPPADLLAGPAARDSPPEAQGPERVPVRILALPLSLYREAQQHNDALIREFQWLTERGTTEGAPERLLELAAEVRASFATESDSLRAQVKAATDRGEDLVDIEMQVPRVAWDVLVGFARLLEEADEFCERGEMLTLASSPRLRRFRTWYVGEAVSQLNGNPPTPWAGDEPTTADETA